MAIVEVIKYNGKPNVFAWKYPNEELGTWSQIIVNEAQEVVFLKEGKILDVLEAGRHTLSTENIPLLSKLINLPFGKKSPFTAEIWYINKAYALNIKWGTPTRIQLQDPKYNVFIPVRAFGQFGIQIHDAKTFLTKLVGTLNIFDEEQITDYFRGLFISNIKDVISSYLIEKQISILEINSYLKEIQEELQKSIEPTLLEYGIKLANFYVTSIDTPEDDSAVIQLKEALAKKAEMDIVGYNYAQERSFDTLEGAATNENGAGSNLMGAGIGLGMGFGMGGTFANQMGDIGKNMTTSSKLSQTAKKEQCPHCKAKIEKGQKFCSECGNKIGTVCKKCGATLQMGQKFCPECGTAQINTCPNCKKQLPENAKFCANCGQKL